MFDFFETISSSSSSSGRPIFLSFYGSFAIDLLGNEIVSSSTIDIKEEKMKNLLKCLLLLFPWGSMQNSSPDCEERRFGRSVSLHVCSYQRLTLFKSTLILYKLSRESSTFCPIGVGNSYFTKSCSMT